MAILNELPEELFMDILSRIPAKSLLCSKSVSKHWYALINNANFISLHYARAHLNYCLRLVHVRPLTDYASECSISLVPSECSMSLVPSETPTSIQHLDLSFTAPHLKEFFFHRGSCNGLICLSVSVDSTIVICNPAIREFRLVPPPPGRIRHTGTLGFGFDSTTNDYKVVRVATLFLSDLEPFDANDNANDESDDDDVCDGDFDRHSHTPVDQNLQIYSMSTDSWKEIGAKVPSNYFDPRSLPCTSSDGVWFYWFCYNYSSKVTLVVALNTVEGSFKEIPLPPGISFEYGTNVCLLNDSLALVALSKYDKILGESRFEVWLRDESGGEGCWTKKYTVGYPLGLPNVVGSLPNNKVLVMGFDQRQFMTYDLSTHDTKEYKRLAGHPDSAFFTHVFPYSESLVSVKRQVDLA